jgi:hypothetical protein
MLDVVAGTFSVGDCISIEVAHARQHLGQVPLGDYVMHGHVYAAQDGFLYVSCGGLLARCACAVAAAIGDDLYISVTKISAH